MNVTYREKDGNIQAIISYKSNGKWKQKSKQGFAKKTDAKKWAKDKMYELLELEDKNIIEDESTLSDVFDKYIELLKIRNSSPNTIYTYLTTLKFIDEIKDKPIKSYTSFDIEMFFQQKSKKSGFSYQQYLYLLKIVFNFARDDLKIIPENPIKKLKLEKSDDNRIKYIDENLYHQILEAFNGKDRILIQLAYNTGMRVSELFGITLKDIHKDYIDVNKQWYGGEFHKMKTKNSYRKIPINSDLYKLLKSQTTDINGRIFYDSKRGCITHKLSRFNTSMHCFRHTFATRLLSENISPKYVSEVTGDNINTIYKNYLEVNQDTVEKEKEQIRKMIL